MMKRTVKTLNLTPAEYTKDTKRAQRRADWERHDRDRMYDDVAGVDTYCAERESR